MTQMDARMGFAATGSSPDEPVVQELIEQIRRIGLARFVGRINAGIIGPDEGYQAVQRFVAQERQRPFFSRLGQALVGRPNSYDESTQY